MRLHDGSVISRSEVSPHKFGGDPMAEYLHHLAGYGGQDDDTGSSVDWHTWCAKFGRRLLYEDSQGFVWVQRFDSAEAADADFQQIHSDFCDFEEETDA